MIAPDYRQVMVIHGYRHVEQIGGGCVMTHIDHAEAFAPAVALRNRLMILGALSLVLAIAGALLLARRTSRPLNALTRRAQALQAGDFDSPFPSGGPRELAVFSATFERMARSLRASELRTRSVLDNALDAVIGMDSDGLTIDWNQRAEQLFGWSREEALGQPLHQLIVPEHLRDAHVHGLRRFLETGEHVVLNRRVEISGAHRDGRQFPVELTVTPLRVDGGWKFYAFLRDLTAAHRSKELEAFMTKASTLLAESLEFDDTIARVARLAVSVLADFCTVTVRDGDGAAQRLAAAYADAEQEESVLRAIREHLPAGAAPGLADVLESGRSQLIEQFPDEQLQAIASDYPGLQPLLERFPPQSSMVVAMRTRGRVVGAITLISTHRSGRRYDSRDLLLAEEFGRRCGVALENARLYREANEAIAVRDEFLSIASHELRTPLTPLLLHVQMLQRMAPAMVADAEPRAWLEARLAAVHGQGARIKRLVDELLDVVRMKRGELRIEAEPVDLGEIVEEARDALVAEGVLDPSRLTIVHGAERIVGHWDRLRVQQIVTNLLANAAKYGEGAPIRIEVEVADGQARLRVEDAGPGIAAEDQARIFEPLERAAAARHHGGLGLGLYVCRQAAHAMGGAVAVRSEPGQGAAFEVVLPLAGAGSPIACEATRR